MLAQTLQKLEDLIKSAPELADHKRHELLNAINELRQKALGLSQSEQDKVSQAVALNKFEEFELSHPKLYEIAKDLSMGLNGLGV